jgi:hypothetical protein
MKLFTIIFVSLAGISLSMPGQVKRDYPIQPVAFTQVQVTDNFWAPKISVNANVTIPYTLDQCRRTGRIDNFKRAAARVTGRYHDGIYLRRY